MYTLPTTRDWKIDQGVYSFFFSFKKDEIDVVVEVRVLILYDSSFKVWKFYLSQNKRFYAMQNCTK